MATTCGYFADDACDKTIAFRKEESPHVAGHRWILASFPSNKPQSGLDLKRSVEHRGHRPGDTGIPRAMAWRNWPSAAISLCSATEIAAGCTSAETLCSGACQLAPSVFHRPRDNLAFRRPDRSLGRLFRRPEEYHDPRLILSQGISQSCRCRNSYISRFSRLFSYGAAAGLTNRCCWQRKRTD